MAKIFSLDLGTASIGVSVRDTDNGNTIEEQLSNFGSVIFSTTVNKDGKGNYKSLATNRREKRSPRRLYQSRKYRIWETLKILIDPANKNKKDAEIDLDKPGIYCPLTMRELNRWRRYDKANGLKRQYPVDVERFEQWVRLDFDGDGKPDYSSPYQLRAELAISQLDFSMEINRYKLGRALYHIAQRRGFKSSKGETLKDQEDAIKENADTTIDLENISLKKSEEKKSKDLKAYMDENNLPTAGCAFAQLEKEGIRIRANIYQAVRSQYKEEIKHIFDFQNGLNTDSDFFKVIYSDRKDGSIFYKRPLRSQKGLVGKCTLEPAKSRCPISHPEFEKFRAFALINNIQYRKTINDEWQNLTSELKLKLYKEKFLLTKSNFKFEEIRKWIEKEIEKPLSKKQKVADSTINYADKANVSGCPISGRLKNLLGGDWESFVYETSEKRKDRKGKEHNITFNMEDIWHICFSYDDEEAVAEFAKTKLNFDDKQVKSLVNLWIAIPQGYSMLSLKAIRNINQFLVPNIENELYKGFIYTEAALLGKIPEVLGRELWQENEKELLESISSWIDENREEKWILNIANSLIANYKLEYADQQRPTYDSDYGGYKNDYQNTKYLLDEIDLSKVEQYTKEAFGEKTWERVTQENKGKVLKGVTDKYQQFFSTSKRDYFRLPKLGDTLKLYLSNNFLALHCENQLIDPATGLPCQCPACKKLNKLYHPSMVEFYKPAKEQTFEYNGTCLSKKLLESPVIGAFKNPMAMRTLHELRKLVNYFLKEGIVEEDTRVVVETARDLNDANMRWAIDAYQREREKDNKEIAKAIKELRGEERNDDDIDKARLLIEQERDYIFDSARYITEKEQEDNSKKKKKIVGKAKDFQYKKDVTKYRLWLEQGMQCMYTGKIINIKNLFDENATDFEHTIPRSLSFDNSLANLTVCDAYYNRQIKKNRIPTQLENYEKEATINGHLYSAIKPRLEKWEQKVEQLRNNVTFWEQKSKQAQTKDTKDYAIRQGHLWRMELDCWQNKLERFTMTEVTSGFKHSQLNDTRLITKYAYHYLKSVFSKVEVQKGGVTADFRKMLGVQSVDEKKDREKHSHHAIDAVILSLIPVAAKRDKMLELFYKIDEEKKLNNDTTELEQALQKEIRSCQIGNVSNLAQYIEENILINHVSKDRTLTPAKRNVRKRGKIVYDYYIAKESTNLYQKIDKKGNIISEALVPEKNISFAKNFKNVKRYKHLENGSKIYYAISKIIQGDCIRGQLHSDSFYGAITQAKIGENGKILREKSGKIITNDEIFYVIRRELKYKKTQQDKGFKDLEDLQNQIVDKNLGKLIAQQCEGKSFKDACEEGFYMIDKKGNRVNRIRHIRCFTSIKNPLAIKKQTYKSDKEYKQNYYADVGDLYAMCKYINDSQKSVYKIYSLFDISENRKYNLEDIPTTNEKGNKLEFVIKCGDTLLLYENNQQELYDMTSKEQSKRLYTVLGFENPSTIKLKRHLNSMKDSDLGKGESIKDFNNLPEKIRCSVNTLNFLFEGKDFEMNLDGTITFKY